MYKRILLIFSFSVCANITAQITYPIVDTGVAEFYDDTSLLISAPSEGDSFYGQDATYDGNQPSYTDNNDGTITDNVTGLMWQQDMGSKISYDAAVTKAAGLTLGGYSDWRIPTIKELYSLALFTGRCFGDEVRILFIDTNYFDQPIGDTNNGEREIDAQTWSQTPCIDDLIGGDESIYGYNFADGRLKGYPKYDPKTNDPNTMYFRMVRGNTSYGVNDFSENGNGTITDNATGLMWQQADSGQTYDWEDALEYAEDLVLGGHSDWRLPNAKELQSIVNYTRSPKSTTSPAIDAKFSCTSITDISGRTNQYGYYWTSSPLKDGPNEYSDAAYFCFGEAYGQMQLPSDTQLELYDVHGVGAQRNDPKTETGGTYPDTFGPQGDIRYVLNFVRCVRDASTTLHIDESSNTHGIKVYPNPSSSECFVESPKINLSKIEILNAKGQIIKTVDDPKSITTIDISSLSVGIYVLKIQGSDNTVFKKLIVK